MIGGSNQRQTDGVAQVDVRRPAAVPVAGQVPMVPQERAAQLVDQWDAHDSHVVQPPAQTCPKFKKIEPVTQFQAFFRLRKWKITHLPVIERQTNVHNNLRHYNSGWFLKMEPHLS